ncbi:MAG: hypothetical protein IT221_10400 [Fluviicola sp.]|nr:hypothetical protein [Fluviicola sp.]
MKLNSQYVLKAIAVSYMIVGFLFFVDYFLPYSNSVHPIEKLLIETSKQVRGSSRENCYLKINQTELNVSESSYRHFYEDDTLVVSRTLLTNQIIQLRKKRSIKEEVSIIEVPYTFFPLFPILLMLPAFFYFIKKDTVFFMAGRIVTLILAVVITLIWIF